MTGIVCLPLDPEWWPGFDGGWDYDTHPGDCCAAIEGDVWTVCCRECAGTGVWPVPWIAAVEHGRDDPTASCVACKASGRASITLAAPPSDSAYLSAERVAALPEGAPITVTWGGGNGPHDYVVTVDRHGGRWATQPEHIGRWMQFYNRLTFIGSERFHTRVASRPRGTTAATARP